MQILQFSLFACLIVEMLFMLFSINFIYKKYPKICNLTVSRNHKTSVKKFFKFSALVGTALKSTETGS